MDDATASEWSQRCRCGKRFYQPNTYTTHINSCQAYKKGVSSSLEAAKARWAAKIVKGKKGKEAIESWYGNDDLDVDIDIARPPAPLDNGDENMVRLSEAQRTSRSP
ncbi:hypothetical protein NMY22_g18789 [Coprinellus aureogranulatus]|nr:hypothetical protein NMY22_g18789 [Coprinellus aureogranulatus]